MSIYIVIVLCCVVMAISSYIRCILSRLRCGNKCSHLDHCVYYNVCDVKERDSVP